MASFFDFIKTNVDKDDLIPNFKKEKKIKKEKSTPFSGPKDTYAPSVNDVLAEAKATGWQGATNSQVKPPFIKAQSDFNFKEYVLKNHDFVKIVKYKNSPMNIYKGYNGEIKQFFKGTQYALVALEAKNGSQFIKFNVEHLVKRDFSKD